MHRISVLVLCIFTITVKLNSFKVEVKVKEGKVIGTTGRTVFEDRIYYAFYGVPYARIPVGKLRFKNPKPSMKWKHPFDATTEYHGACAQSHIVHKHAIFGVEDCLNMNLYTPYLPRKEIENLRAVIVWVHGHSFTSSFSHIHGADFLIDNDVLFISVTHRIGVFGFLKLNDIDTNMGLRDIVMAVKWIRRNIIFFGGDKNRITVMGSGSAGTFLSLLSMTKHRKLFSKMILHSGAIYSPSLFQGDPQLEIMKLRAELRKIDKKDLLKTSAKNIIFATQKLYNNKEIMNVQRPIIPFLPVIEKQNNNTLITIKTEKLLHAENLKPSIPLLIGFNSQESISEAIPFLRNPKYLKSFSDFFKFMVPFYSGCKFEYNSSTYKRVSQKITRKYFKGVITENSLDAFLQYTTDLRKYPIYKFIKAYSKLNTSKMFVYKFNYVGKFNAVKATSMAGVNIRVKGAAHGDEICYILKCEPYWENYVKIKNDTLNRDRIFIKSIAEMWANFAKTGHPTPLYTMGTTWLPMTPVTDNILLIGRVKKLVNSKTEEKMYRFWNGIYEDYYADKHCNNDIHNEL